MIDPGDALASIRYPPWPVAATGERHELACSPGKGSEASSSSEVPPIA